MLADKCGWDLSKLRQLFDDATIQAILNIPLWLRDRQDKWVWVKNHSGELTVKSAYREASSHELHIQVALLWGKI